MPTPEELARQNIDAALEAAGWCVQDAADTNLYAGRGVAVREFSLERGHGVADYLLFVDQQAVGAIEAKPEGMTLTGVELQSEKYSDGLPSHIPAAARPLPFLYQSTGVVTRFTNRLDPEPRSRRVFTIYRPETLAEWVVKERRAPAGADVAEGRTAYGLPETMRGCLQHLPPVVGTGLWPAQLTALRNLEEWLPRLR